jgi:aminoglycoside phosphotransferase (APT) family kinase protein
MDYENLAELSRRALPNVHVLSAVKVAQGHSHDCWRLMTNDGEMLLKVCVRRPSNDALQNEVVAHQMLADHGVSAPRIFGSVPLPNELDVPYYVQEWVPGVSAEEGFAALAVADRIAFARDFAEAVARMHSIEGPFFANDLFGSNKAEQLADYCEYRLQDTTANVATSSFPAQLAEKALSRCAELIRSLPSGIKASFVHRDLYLPNVLLCENRYMALIDLESARFNDPILDFVKLDIWVFMNHPDLKEPFMTRYHELRGWDDEHSRRLMLHKGIEYLYSFWYFDTKFPSPPMRASFRDLIDAWMIDFDALS